jgi:uncharacterized protein (TIGR03790 family)
VANKKSERSIRIAEYYLSKRRIPKTNCVRIETSPDRTSPFGTFRAEVAEPIRRHLAVEGIGKSIDYIVLTDGIPIRVRMPGGYISSCALLAVLDTPLFGRPQVRLPKLKNPYQNSGKAFTHGEAFEDLQLYLVTFLIGYTEEDAKRLVDLSLESDGKPVQGDFLFQDARGPASGRNAQYASAIQRLKEKEFEVEHHPAGPDVIKDRKGIMGYMSGGSYSALKREGIGSLRFHPGALVDMLESFGAVPENFEPRKKKQVPVTWFVEAGATGVHGAVAEPYAHTFPDTLLFERYTQGFNLAEAYYQSLPFLYWMNMVIGDPLAAPYAKAPEVALSAGGLEVVSGQILAQITAKPPQGTRIRALQLDFDGLPVGTARGAEGKIVWDTRKFRNGKGVLHAAAILDGPVAVQGHAFLDVEVRNAELTLVRTFPRDGEANASRAGPIRITCNKALAPACAGEGGLAVTVRDGDRVPGRWMVEEDRHVLAFLPGEPLAASTAFRVTVPPGVQCAEGKSLGGAPVSFGFTTTAASLALTAPNETTGGTAFDVEIKALDGKGELWPGFRGTVYLMGDDPHASFPAVIRFTAKDGGKRTVKVTLGASGERTLKAADFLAGVEGTVKVEVTSGLFEKIRVDLPRQTGLGQEVEVRFRAVDSFGNKVESVVGEFQIAAPAQSVAEHPKRLTFTLEDGGEVTLGGFSFGAPGNAGIVVLDASGKRVGQGSTKVVDSPIRSWLFLGPFKEPRKLPGNVPLPLAPETIRPHPGRIEGTKVWKPSTSKTHHMTASALPANGFGFFHVWVSCKGSGAGLRVGTDDLFKLWVNGHKVHETVQPLRRKPGPVKTQALVKGWNRLLVWAARTRKGAPRFTVKLVDASGKTPLGTKIRLGDPEGNAKADVSGAVRAGRKGVAGVTVTLTGGEGEPRSTVTDEKGWFAFRGVEKESYEVRVTGRSLTYTPESTRIEAGPKNVYGLVFQVEDRAAPRVLSISLKEKERVAGRVEVEVEAMDNLGVDRIRFLVDGNAVGSELDGEKVKGVVDFTALEAGSHTFGAVAVDGAGNESAVSTVRVWVVKDTAKPKVRLLQPRRAQIARGTTVLKASVTDNYGVAKVTFLFDGKPVGTALTREPWEATLDASKVNVGPHEIWVTAEDTSGNVTTRKYRVTVK